MSIQAIELVFTHSRTHGGNRLVLLALASHADADMVAWPGVETLRKKAGFDHGRSVTRCLRDLEAIGEIERAGTGKSGVAKYRITIATPDRAVTPSDAQPLTHGSPDRAVTPDPQVTPTPDRWVTPCASTPDRAVTTPLTGGSPEPSMNQKKDSDGSRPKVRDDAGQPPLFDDITSGGNDHRPASADFTSAFAAFWERYPNRGAHGNPRKPALERFTAAVKRGADPAAIIRGAENYAAAVAQERTEPRFVAQAVTWLNQERWQEYQHQPAPSRQDDGWC